MNTRAGPATRVLRKYGSRRIYDPERTGYVTLDEIAAMLRAGLDLRVIDAKSGEDLTRATVTQVLLEARSFLSSLTDDELFALARASDEEIASRLVRDRPHETQALQPTASSVTPHDEGPPAAAAPPVAPSARASTLAWPAPHWPAPVTPGARPHGGIYPALYAAPSSGGAELGDEVTALRRELAALRAVLENAREKLR